MVAVNADGSLLASASNDHVSTLKRDTTRKIAGPKNYVCLQTVRVWTVGGGTNDSRALTDHSHVVECVTFVPESANEHICAGVAASDVKNSSRCCTSFVCLTVENVCRRARQNQLDHFWYLVHATAPSKCTISPQCNVS